MNEKELKKNNKKLREIKCFTKGMKTQMSLQNLKQYELSEMYQEWHNYGG